MNSSKVKITAAADPELLSNGTFLLLYHAGTIPPHIMLLCNGFYYSLSVRGSEIKEPLSKLIRRIHQAKSKVVFINVIGPQNFDDPSAYFRKYDAPEEGKTTCLFPVRDYLNDYTGIEVSGCRFVFELFEELQKNQKTGEAYHMYLDDLSGKNNYFYFPVYTSTEIDKCIWLNRLTSSFAEGE